MKYFLKYSHIAGPECCVPSVLARAGAGTADHTAESVESVGQVEQLLTMIRSSPVTPRTGPSRGAAAGHSIQDGAKLCSTILAAQLISN